ncbi:MAG: FAD-dependent oxidoreductase, partial [Pirellulales bacterium]
VIACRACIMAVPWRMAGRLVPAVVPEGGEGLEGSPITAVHLWFDRQVIDLPHAVLLGRLSQWVFRPDEQQGSRDGGYCQVVISGSHDLLRGDRKQLLEKVVQELRELFPAAEAATLLDSRIVTDPTAVLSVRPGVDALRPASATSVANLFLAGDWTATGWPSTMEGAVRSGRLAAAACLSACGSPQAVLAPDLPRGRLVRWLTIGRA